MRKTLAIVRIAVVVMVIAARAQAQPGVTPPTPPPPVLAPPPVAPLPPPPEAVEAPKPREYHVMCFEGRPFECGSVFLLETGPRWGTANVWTLDIGFLVNVDRYAIGATFGGMAYETEGNPEGSGSKLYKARFRRYLGDDGFALDAAVGFDDDAYAGEVALGYGDLIAVTAGMHTVDGDPSRDVGMNVGVRIGAEVIGGIIYVIGSIAGSAR